MFRNRVVQDVCDVVEQGQQYCVRHVDWQDSVRLDEYQKLRADIFVRQFGWSIPIDSQGRERDRYDQSGDPTISIHAVYGVCYPHSEHFLGGGRIFQLRTWNDSMVMNEFYDAGMIPNHVLRLLENHYDCHDILEFSRVCVRRGRRYIPFDQFDSGFTGFDLSVVRDLTYASVLSMAEKTGRRSLLAVVNTLYLHVAKRSHFVYREIYSRQLETRQGYAVIVIDLAETIHAIRAAGNSAMADRMLALCTNKDWVNGEARRDMQLFSDTFPVRDSIGI